MPIEIHRETMIEIESIERYERMTMVSDVMDGLTSETVESAALSLESVNDIEGGDCLALCVLCVCDGVTDNTLKEGLQDTTGLFVNHRRDTFHTTTTSQTSDGWLGNTLNVVSQNLAMALGATLSETLSTLSASSHDEFVLEDCKSCLVMNDASF